MSVPITLYFSIHDTNSVPIILCQYPLYYSSVSIILIQYPVVTKYAESIQQHHDEEISCYSIFVAGAIALYNIAITVTALQCSIYCSAEFSTQLVSVKIFHLCSEHICNILFSCLLFFPIKDPCKGKSPRGLTRNFIAGNLSYVLLFQLMFF